MHEEIRTEADDERTHARGTWKAAVRAVRFSEKHGYRLVTVKQKDQLPRTYWKIPERQVEASVVLGDRTWSAGARGQEKKGRT